MHDSQQNIFLQDKLPEINLKNLSEKSLKAISEEF